MVKTLEKDKYLMKQCFESWNALKRHMTLEEAERERGNIEEARKFELLKYKAMARLELNMRSLQSELWKGENNEEDNNG